jgi:hypothetical protein
VVIYGWNEYDEGGWLQPTFGADQVVFEDGILTASPAWDSVLTKDAYGNFRMHRVQRQLA